MDKANRTLVPASSMPAHLAPAVVDDRDLYLIGASLKDLGRKCFGFTRIDPAEIPGLKARL